MIASGWRRKARPTTITAAAALRAAWRKSCPSGNLSNSFRSALPSTRTFAVVIGSPVNSGTASSSCAQATSRGCCSPSDGRQRGDASEPPFGEKSKLTCIRGALQWLPPVKGTVALFSPATRSRNAERAFHEPVCDLLPARSPTRPSSSTPPSCAWNGSPRFTKIRDFVSSRSTLETGHFRDTGRRFYRLIT